MIERVWVSKYQNIVNMYMDYMLSLGVPLNVALVERIVACVFCAGDYIVEFITTSPLFMRKTAIAPVNGTTNLYYITITWTPTSDQIGPQVSNLSIYYFVLSFDLIDRYFVLLLSINED